MQMDGLYIDGQAVQRRPERCVQHFRTMLKYKCVRPFGRPNGHELMAQTD